MTSDAPGRPAHLTLLFDVYVADIWYRQQAGRLERLRRVELVWICRDSQAFEWFQSLLAQIEQAQTDPEFLRVSVYLTQKVDEDDLANITLNEYAVIEWRPFPRSDSLVTSDSVDAECDPLTQLSSRTHFGRPVWSTIYSRLVASMESESFPGRESSLRLELGTWYCGVSR